MGIDMVGEVYGRLTVVRKNGKNKGGNILWLCLCDCGDYSTIVGYSLRRGLTKSCGCLAKEVARNRMIKHGQSIERTKSYSSWNNMLQRCENKNNKDYKSYGGKGILVCQEWHDFNKFYDDMGACPKKHSIDRVDRTGNYEPSNCRWATDIVQARNTSRNVFIEFNGERKCVSEWAHIIGISRPSLSLRLKRWGLEKAMTTPKMDKWFPSDEQNKKKSDALRDFHRKKKANIINDGLA